MLQRQEVQQLKILLGNPGKRMLNGLFVFHPNRHSFLKMVISFCFSRQLSERVTCIYCCIIKN